MLGRAEIDVARRRLAVYRKHHRQLIESLRTHTYEPSKEEQNTYRKARVFWVREWPTLQETLTEALTFDTQLQHCFYVFRKSYEDPNVEDALHQLRDLAHVKDIAEVAMAGEDLFQRYEAYLGREEGRLPTARQAALGNAQRIGSWLSSRPAWIEANKTAAFLMTFWALLVLALLGLVTPALLAGLAEVIRAIRGG